MPRTVSITELVFDQSIYPRKEMDQRHVEEIRAAMETGVALPPIVVQKKSMRIVDGVHRYFAYMSGSIEEVEVVEKSYASEAELFLDCVRLNSGHGKRLTEADKLVIAEKATGFSIADGLLADSLCVLVVPRPTLTVARPKFSNEKLPFVRSGDSRRPEVTEDEYVKAPECGHKALESTLHDGWCMACWSKRGGAIRTAHEYKTEEVAERVKKQYADSDMVFIRRRNVLYANTLCEVLEEDEEIEEEFSDALVNLARQIDRRLSSAT